MSLVEVQQLLAAIAPPLDASLSRQLLDEFVSLERRYIQRDWEASELDGGQFAEILARLLYAQDSGNINRNKSLDDCLGYIENDQVSHLIAPRTTALHLSRILRLVYKIRSQRGAVHISPTYKPNQMDSRLVIECVRWALMEVLRVFWQGDRERVAKAIREILQFDVPAIGHFGRQILVQRTDLAAKEELLILLHYAGEAGLSRLDLGRHAMRAPSTVSDTLKWLSSANVRQVVQLANGNYRLTDLGSREIRKNLAPKLLLE